MADLIPETMDKTQGLVAEQEAAQAAVPIPTSPVPPLATPPAPAAPPAGGPQQQAAAPFAPTSYMQTVPANILFAQHNTKASPMRQQSNMRLFWEVVARRSSDPVIQSIYNNLGKS